MQQVFVVASVSGPFQRRDLSNCGTGRLLSVECWVHRQLYKKCLLEQQLVASLLPVVWLVSLEFRSEPVTGLSPEFLFLSFSYYLSLLSSPPVSTLLSTSSPGHSCFFPSSSLIFFICFPFCHLYYCAVCKNKK